MLKPGDIVFSHSRNNVLSDAIAWFMTDTWSHCFMILEVADYRTYCIEAVQNGVVISSFNDEYLKDPDTKLEVWSPIGITDEQRAAIVRAALAHCGERYGYLQYVSLAVRGLLKKVGIKCPNWIKRGIVCYEEVDESYKTANIMPFSQLRLDDVDLDDVYQLVTVRGFTKVFSKPYGSSRT